MNRDRVFVGASTQQVMPDVKTVSYYRKSAKVSALNTYLFVGVHI